MAERSHKHPQTGKTVRKTLALHRERAEEEENPPKGKRHKTILVKYLLFFPTKNKKNPLKLARDRLNLDLRANFLSENKQPQGKGSPQRKLNS